MSSAVIAGSVLRHAGRLIRAPYPADVVQETRPFTKVP